MGADPETFELFEGKSYTRDSDTVFFEGKTVTGADPETFQVFKHSYAMDANRVYYGGKPKSSVDRAAVEIVDGIPQS